MTIGERIKKTRDSINLSQTELARLVNISKQTLYKYENNIITNIPSDKIELIAEVLKVSPAFLMGWDREPDEIDKKVLELYPDFVPGKVFISDIVDARQKEEQLKNYLSSIYSDKEMIEDAYEINMNMQLYNKDGLKKLRERAEEISELSKYTDKDDETPPT